MEFKFNLDMQKVALATQQMEERKRAGYNEDATTARNTYLDKVGKKDAPNQIFYRLLPFNMEKNNGMFYFDQQGWFIEAYNRIVSPISIGEPDEAYDMYLTALEMAKTDSGIAAIVHKDNYGNFQFQSQYMAPIMEFQPVVDNVGNFTGDFTIDPDPKKVFRMGVFRQSLWDQTLAVITNAFNNPAKTVYGDEGKIWCSTKDAKDGKYKTERIEFTWRLSDNPAMTPEHQAELADWYETCSDYFRAGITDAETRIAWMNYVFQGGPRPANARPKPQPRQGQTQNQPPQPQFGGGGLMSKLKK